jgi:molecular chaperone HtpG
MRRMKDMSKLGGGMSFYGDMPESFNLVININHSIIENLASDVEKAIGEDIKKQSDSISSLEKDISETEKSQEGKNDEEISQAEKDKLEALNKKMAKAQEKKKEIITKFADKKPVVQQLIDLALLANNMLKGEKLSTFVKRSIDLL